jgi:glutathione peroxidase-family protein
MKKLITFGFVIWALGFVWLSGIHTYSVPKIEGGSQSLSAYQGKKILVITLPLVQNPAADSLLYSLDTLGTAHIATLKVIAVPALEDGYTGAQKTALQQWYRSKLGNHILITEGLYTRKTSGSQQHPLFKWLTKDTENEVFDVDVEGPGYKFFTTAGGALYGVLRPHSTMWGQSVQRTLWLQ